MTPERPTPMQIGSDVKRTPLFEWSIQQNPLYLDNSDAPSYLEQIVSPEMQPGTAAEILTRLRAILSSHDDLVAALKATIGPLEYAYRNVSSITADKVKSEILPQIRAILTRTDSQP